MRARRLLAFWIIVLLWATAAPSTRAQSVSLSVQAGFDGLFRENLWTPLYIEANNDGPAVEGRLVVRPATSGSAVSSAYSLPISLPEGSRKTAFLYITARSFATQVREELVTAEGVVIASQNTPLRAIQPQDQLYAVISGAAAGTVDLTGVRSGSYSAYQANWSLDNLPDRAAALEAVSLMLFSDTDTGALSTGQRRALADWVAAGGHLIVTGGANWQATASGLSDLLPLRPSGSAALSDLAPLAAWVRYPEGGLNGQTVEATGTLEPGADILVGQGGVLPLIARRTLGAGTVDYLAFDPNARPARGWPGLTDLFFTLSTTTGAQPGWSDGLYNWEQAISAANVMPGVNLLPDILPLCGFLSLYIALIGPLNYIVLNRLNRRELAWVTIPLFIALFSALSWVIGSNLRGSEVTISRLALVQSWPDAERARVEEMLGLLSPRRDQYTLTALDDAFLRPVSRVGQTPLLPGGVQNSADVQQENAFRAADIPVDASFIAAFNAQTFIERPDIGGQARLFSDGPEGQHVMRGSVRNDSGQTLHDPVILARGASLRLDEPLAPGDVVTFDLTLPGEGLPAPARLAFAPGGFAPYLARSYSARTSLPQTVSDILNVPGRDWAFYSRGAGESPQEQEAYRRRIFLSALVNDPYNLTTGRGYHAYLAGWANSAPINLELEGSPWVTLDTTLYLVQLAVEVEKPAGETVVPPELFTWTVENLTGLRDIAPFSIELEPGEEAVFRFTPLPEAVLRQVRELTINLDRGVSIARRLPIQIWNWETDAWDDIEVSSGSQHIIREPQAYLGPQNAVQVRLIADDIGSYPRIQDVTVEQRGRF